MLQGKHSPVVLVTNGCQKGLSKGRMEMVTFLDCMCSSAQLCLHLSFGGFLMGLRLASNSLLFKNDLELNPPGSTS